jgi:hypothetical protein
MKKSMILAAAAAALAAGSVANAETYYWEWNYVDGTNPAGGAFESISASYDNVSHQFVWNTVFSNQITQGYTLAVNSGPDPKGHGGELALIYFDATGPSERVNVFAYNGANLSNSWQDGDGRNEAPGDQTADYIYGFGDSRILNADMFDTGDGKRHFNLTLDATGIQNHIPLYPQDADGDGVNDWTGLAFGPEQLGLWFHTYTGLTTSYGQNGQLCQWDFNGQGWFDGAGLQLVPLPTSAWMGLAGVGMAGVIVRRRKAANRAE